jgi:hypothetical protein
MGPGPTHRFNRNSQGRGWEIMRGAGLRNHIANAIYRYSDRLKGWEARVIKS